MQLRPEHLAQRLEHGLARVYAVHGDEPLQAQEAADAIRACARMQGFTERSVHTVLNAQHFDWGEVLAAGGSMSLFGDRQLLEVRIPGGKPGTEGSTALQTLAEQTAASDGVVLVLVTLPRLDATGKKSGWFTALEAHGVAVPCDPIDRAVLPSWLAQRLAAQGQRVREGEEGERTLAFFADRIEGNLLAAHQELQKLALLHPAGELGYEHVEAAVVDVARYELSRLTLALLAGQLARVQRVLDALEAEGEAVVLVANTVAGDIRALARACDALDAGEPLPMAMRAAAVWGDRQRAFERILPRINRSAIARLLVDAHRVDGIVKGLRAPDWPHNDWQALHRLCMRLCRVVAAALGR